MFQKLRIKIIAIIMSVLTILFISILLAIYVASYQRSIEHTKYVLKKLTRSKGFEIIRKDPYFDKYYNSDNYYLVLVGPDQKIEKILNHNNSGYTNKQLGNMAITLSNGDTSSGKVGNLFFYKKVRQNGTFISFANNRLQMSYYKTLFSTILIFGCIGLILLFLISIWLSRWLIKPVENSFIMQKQFISNASHELKTPIAIISSNTEALKNEIGDSKWLEYIRTETNSLNNLVSNLLQLATIDSDSDRTMFTKVNLSELVLSIALPFEIIAYEKQLLLNEQIEDNIFIIGDSTKLGQLVTILIDNALNYSDMGGNILVKLTTHHEKKILTVTNTGKEIPLAEQELIFDRFYRVDEARSRENGNYGLGLSIAKSITLLHNGKISVSSKNNLTTFKVIF